LKAAIFNISDLCDLDVGLGHMACHRMSLINLYLLIEIPLNWKNYLWMNGQTL